MDRITIGIGTKEFTFSVKFERDDDAGAPWDNCEGHGVVSDWESRDKAPGELVLNSDGRGRRRFYDFAASCRLALRDRWDAAPYNDGSETKRQQAAKAARADFEYLQSWCANDWEYVGVIVTLLDEDGEETEVSDSLWCVESRDDYHHETARQLADELAGGYGVSWDEVSKTSYGYTQRSAA